MKNNIRKNFEKIRDFLEFKHIHQRRMAYFRYIFGSMLIIQAIIFSFLGEIKLALALSVFFFCMIIISEETGKYLVRQRIAILQQTLSEEDRVHMQRVLERWWRIVSAKIARFSKKQTENFIRSYYFLDNLLKT